MFKKISVLGSGSMGHGIAQNYALAGFNVFLYDLNEELLVNAFKLIEESLTLLIEEEIITYNQKVKTLERIVITTDIVTASTNADFITEAVSEDLTIKHNLFKKLEEIVSEETIIASNTSTFSISQLTENIQRPNRFIITHFFNPAQLVPLVEIVKHEKTSRDVVEITIQLMREIGKTPIVLNKDIPGFIANRLQAALVREALYLLDEEIADAESIDLALTSGLGYRWAISGALQTMDYGGLDIWKSVIENLTPELSKSELIPQFINDKITEGQLGTKTGEGIYTYVNDSATNKLKSRDKHLIQLMKLITESRSSV